jgi:DNA sulfur modification protein DndB
VTDELVGPLIAGDEIAAELRRRRSQDIFKTVSGSTKKLIAEKVKLEEEDGWRVVKRNTKSTRMAKPKPGDEQLEDEVWSVLAQMGFKEMSRGRQFLLAVEENLPGRQIDVFAKDDESIIIVECTQRDQPSKKNMAPLIEKIRAIREPVLKSIKAFYGNEKKLKIKFVIATRNISWNEVDLAKCKEAQIAVISDGELDYYASLVRLIKQAARYQFLAHMFGGQKIDGLSKTVMATRATMGDTPFYTFLVRPDDLLKIAYVGHKASRDIESLETYQRMLQPQRLKKIAEYINGGGKFPTNIVVNFKTPKKNDLKFDEKEKVGDQTLGVLHLPPIYASAWIIDGQHRLYGYAHARDSGGFNQDKTALPVLAYENLDADKEMNLFIDINSKQVKVNTGLLVELYADLHWSSPDPDEAFQALLSRIASRLNTVKTSPLHDRMVVTGKKKTAFRCLTQTSIRDGLDVAKLLGTVAKGAITVGPFSTSNPANYDANLKKAINVISECFRMFETQLPEHWKTGDGPGGYLCTNNGIRALFHVIQDLGAYIRLKSGSDLYVLSADETAAELAPYLQAIIDAFQTATQQEVQAYRKIGSSLTAVRRQSFGLEKLIQDKYPDFKPAGLQEYLESRDQAGTEQADVKLRKIHRKLFDYVISTLKNHYGTHNKEWWTKGIPLPIRQECTREWEAKNRVGDEENELYLISYIDICIQNWDLVKNVISLDAKDKENKKANTKWIKDLNAIRQITTHPERGTLSTTQVEFVNDMFEKIEKFFPKDGSDSASDSASIAA